MCIPIARAGHRHVDREDKRLAPLLGRHRQKIAHKGAIPYHIELKPDRTRAAHDLRDVTDRDRRKAEENISRPCGSGGLDLTTSEERRVGKRCDRTFGSRWSTYH